MKMDENSKIANIDREIVHIFWTTWRNSMKFSRKICLKIILKVTKKQGFTLFLEDTFPKNHRGIKLTPPPPSHFRVKIVYGLLYNTARYVALRGKNCEAYVEFVYSKKISH